MLEAEAGLSSVADRAAKHVALDEVVDKPYCVEAVAAQGFILCSHPDDNPQVC